LDVCDAGVVLFCRCAQALRVCGEDGEAVPVHEVLQWPVALEAILTSTRDDAPHLLRTLLAN
jgi:hypothetical protein